MTQDEIIEMAKEAGLEVDGVYFSDHMYREVLVRFAHFVAAREREALAQPEQEPVGYWKEHAQGLQRDYDLLLADYEKLAQRTWVGLTDQEHTDIAVECGCMSADWVFYGAAVERKLKEKNFV